MLTADFAAAAVLITYGALLGKTSPLQMILIAFIEIIVFTVNEYIGVQYLKVNGEIFVKFLGIDGSMISQPSSGKVRLREWILDYFGNFFNKKNMKIKEI